MIIDPKEHGGGIRHESKDENRVVPDPNNDLSRGGPGDRKESVRQERPEHRGHSEGEAHKTWERKPEDLDREDTAVRREGLTDENPGMSPKRDTDLARDKS